MEAVRPTDPDPVLAEVEAFLAATGITPTAFGQRALNDPTLVRELRKGRECKRATRSRIQEYIHTETQRLLIAAQERAA